MKKSKLILVIISLLIFSSELTFANTTIDRKVSGGAILSGSGCFAKFNVVQRVEDGETVTIRCYGEGSEDCPPGLLNNTKPYPDSYANAMVDYALSQICANNLSGTSNANFVFGGIMYLRSVSWNGTNLGTNDISVIIIEN